MNLVLLKFSKHNKKIYVRKHFIIFIFCLKKGIKIAKARNFSICTGFKKIKVNGKSKTIYKKKKKTEATNYSQNKNKG